METLKTGHILQDLRIALRHALCSLHYGSGKVFLPPK
jgi:hypothetical protein